MEIGDHVSLDDMTYGELWDVYRSHLDQATGDAYMAIDDARLTGWSDAERENLPLSERRRFGLMSGIVKARELGL